MKKIASVLAACVLSVTALSGCTDDSSQADAPVIPTFSYPENILGADSDLVPTLSLDKYSIPEGESLQFVQDLQLGWNLGNTFDASDCGNLANPLDYESAWCGVKTTIEDIAALKAAGFQTIRIPVSWHNHVDDDFRIAADWMQRVKEVVDWCLACDLSVIVNTHHDNAEAYYYPDSAHLDSSKTYLTAIWQQMADTFADYDQRVILESFNEPRLVGTDYEWWLDPKSDTCTDAVTCINTLNQLFVDTVRATGGNNATRYLLCPGYAASADGATHPKFQLPTDTAANRLIVSVHAYTPYNFALNAAGTKTFDIENPVECKSMTDFMDKLYGMYVAKGIPVLIGEFGARDKSNLEDRVDFAAYYIAAARARGITCCWWDNNAFSGSGENFGLLDRKTATFRFPEIAQALVAYSKQS